MQQHIHAEPVLSAQCRTNLPPACERVVRKAMAKKPEDRYLTAGALARAFAAAIQEPGLSAGEQTAADAGASLVMSSLKLDADHEEVASQARFPVRISRRAWAIIALLALIGIAAGVLIVLYNAANDTDELPCQGKSSEVELWAVWIVRSKVCGRASAHRPALSTALS
jgi:hypothetical protein